MYSIFIIFSSTFSALSSPAYLNIFCMHTHCWQSLLTATTATYQTAIILLIYVTSHWYLHAARTGLLCSVAPLPPTRPPSHHSVSLYLSPSKCLFLCQTHSPPAPPFWATAKLFTRDKLVICLVFCSVLFCYVVFFLLLMCLSSPAPTIKPQKKVSDFGSPPAMSDNVAA